MLSQDGHSLSDASTTRRILTPPSESLQLGSDGARKRKRDGSTMEDLLKDPFVAKPYPSITSVKPRTLQPLLLLPRSQLPLSSLDIISHGGLPQSRLYEAHVKILELEERMGSQPMVLIARLDDGRSLYAVEREARGLYVLLQLGSWIDLHQLKAAAVASRHDLSKVSGSQAPCVPPQPASLSAPEPARYSKKKRLAIEAIQSMVKRPSASLQSDVQQPSENQSVVADPEPTGDSQSQEQLDNSLDNATTQPTATEIFENVRNQYFEALYLSKASLAYFAKGPLSRARAAFHLDYDSNLNMNEYITFLESLVMSTTLIDKKFREGVPGCVSTIDIHDSADETRQEAGKAKKRRGSKKMKPGKNGLYPLEETLIRRWWVGYDEEPESGAPGTSREDVTKSRVSLLRIRETQLQMIIILEVLALQPLASASEDIGGSLPTTLSSSVGGGGKEKTPKSKMPDQLSKLIDVHIDRLCIWQSIALEAVKAPTEGPSQSQKLGDSPASSIHADSVLRDFCVEVILPFFSARLSDRCAVINRKLGGPVVVPPSRPKLSKSASTSNLPSLPGAATKRPVPAKPRRSLQRVLTDDRERRSNSGGSGRAISLMRSATVPAAPRFKREASEAPSLSSVPFADIKPLQANRGGLLNSKRFSQREVDMSSLAPEPNAKKKKQLNIEAELKEAITALKKPNRELAGKALAETAEKRSASASHSRKSKKPVRNPLFQGVQISATPKTNRRRDVFAESQRSSLHETADDEDLIAIPPSSAPRVPQSITRPSTGGLVKDPSLASIQATPTRKPVASLFQRGNPFLGIAAAEGGAYHPQSPLQQRRSSGQLFQVVPESAVKSSRSSRGSQGIQETPIKKRPEVMIGHPGVSTPTGGKENASFRGYATGGSNQELGKAHEDSIYESLGWDDATDIDDLA